MGPEERKVSSRVHTDAQKLFHPHVGKLLCWSYIKLPKANKTTLLGSLKVYFYLMMTFALGVRYSSRKPTRAASMEQILKRTKKTLFLFKSSILVNVRPIAVINERVMSQCTRGGWNSPAVWNTILTFQSLFKIRAASPAQSGLAQGLLRGMCTALGSSAALAVWDSIFIMSSVSLTMYPTACPSLGPEALAPHPFPSFPSQSGCHEDRAGSPPLSQAQLELPAQSKTPGGSHSSGLGSPRHSGATSAEGDQEKLGEEWTISCIYRAAAKLSEKLVLKTNLIASRRNFSGLHFLALILCIAVCVSEQNLIILHPYGPWWLHAASTE